MSIIGLDAFGINTFQSSMPKVRDIFHVSLNNAIYDEISIRERTDISVEDNSKDNWYQDSILIARFNGDLEAGNINNEGIPIDRFAVKRRSVGETKTYTLGYKDFVNNHQFVFEDYTQPNGDFIYSIVPIGVNNLEGQENSINVRSDFAGWFVVDVDDNTVMPFDKFIGSSPDISTSLKQSRTQINTLTRYPSFFYTEQEYHEFSLQSVFLPNEWQRSGQQYENILNKFIRIHKPFLVKGGSGEKYVVDLHEPTKSSPLNVYSKYDHMTLTIKATEIMDYDEYMASSIGVIQND